MKEKFASSMKQGKKIVKLGTSNNVDQHSSQREIQSIMHAMMRESGKSIKPSHHPSIHSRFKE
jgi:hypothetical protein